MRKEAKIVKTVKDPAHIAGYYENGGHEGHTYQYEGFAVNKYFKSDRFELLDENFKRPGGAPMQGFGLEIETSCGTIDSNAVLAEVMDKMIFSHFPADLFKFQSDGSLSGSSTVECITQVMTKMFIRNNYKLFKLMYDHYFKHLGIRCNSSCGMHTNISNAVFGKTQAAQEEAIRKLYYIVNRWYHIACPLFNRRADATTYCRKMPYENAKTMDLHSFYSNHGVCFNLGHIDEGRIELRLVGPQTSYGCFRNTMECVFFLTERVRTIKWADCDDLAKVFEGCNQYVYDRLRTKCDLPQDVLDKIRAKVHVEDLL